MCVPCSIRGLHERPHWFTIALITRIMRNRGGVMLERRSNESDISELRNVFWLSAHCFDDVEILDTSSLPFVPIALGRTTTLVRLACTIPKAQVDWLGNSDDRSRHVKRNVNDMSEWQHCVMFFSSAICVVGTGYRFPYVSSHVPAGIGSTVC